MTQVYNCKERFGYTYLWTCDRTMQNILHAYCEGRSFIWRMFLGWRKCNKDNQEFFWIPSNKLEMLISFANDCKKTD